MQRHAIPRRMRVFLWHVSTNRLEMSDDRGRTADGAADGAADDGAVADETVDGGDWRAVETEDNKRRTIVWRNVAWLRTVAESKFRPAAHSGLAPARSILRQKKRAALPFCLSVCLSVCLQLLVDCTPIQLIFKGGASP